MANVTTLLLDMNDTFMFGGDRFGDEYNYFTYYSNLGGALSHDFVNRIISEVYSYLLGIYPKAQYRESFPKLELVLKNLKLEHPIGQDEIELLIETFSHHELGEVPKSYSDAIKKLSSKYKLALVADIWAPKPPWIKEFRRAEILECFNCLVFSSDTGIVKPSPKPFFTALEQLGSKHEETLVVGDSPRRDLGGSLAAGLRCVLVGERRNKEAYQTFYNFLEFTESVI